MDLPIPSATARPELDGQLEGEMYLLTGCVLSEASSNQQAARGASTKAWLQMAFPREIIDAPICLVLKPFPPRPTNRLPGRGSVM